MEGRTCDKPSYHQGEKVGKDLKIPCHERRNIDKILKVTISTRGTNCGKTIKYH